MKSAEVEVAISSSIKQGYRFNKKIFEVNTHLSKLVGEHKLGFLDNSNIGFLGDFAMAIPFRKK